MKVSERDRRSPAVRLFVPDALGPRETLALSAAQAHHLTTVMRRAAGDRIGVFNGRDGEWLAEVRRPNRNAVTLAVEGQLRAQAAEAGPWLAFAPVKKAATDFIVEKATELGASRLLPVVTGRTIAGRVKTERLRAIATQAAEQSERLSVPEIAEPVALAEFAKAWSQRRMLLIAEPNGGGRSIFEALCEATADGGGDDDACPGFVIGPEGGLTSSELDLLVDLPCAKLIGLGPRILRAETAAAAVLVCWQAIAGDWRPANPGSSETSPSGAR